MSLTEETKEEIRKYILDQEKIKQQLIDEIKIDLMKKLDDPERELTDNEKKLIKTTTKSYNTGILIVTIITAVSIGIITWLYTSIVENDLKIANQKQLEIFEDKLNELTSNFENEIDNSIRQGKDKINDIVDEYKEDSKNLTLKRGEFDAYNSLYNNKKNDIEDLLKALEKGKNDASNLKSEMESLLSNLYKLTESTQSKTKIIEQKLSDSDKLIGLIENSQNLEIKERGSHLYISFGDLFIQWGTGSITGRNTRIDLIEPVSDPQKVSISVVGEDMVFKSFPEIKNVTDGSFEITLWNSDGKRDKWQNEGLFRYTLIGRN